MSHKWFVVFYSEEAGRAVPLSSYVTMMRMGKRVLAKTNPEFSYVVLTDRHTAVRIPSRFHVEIMADKDLPLMRRSMEAQKKFLEHVGKQDHVILAAPDCLATGNLQEATAEDIDIGIPWRKTAYPINNVGYIRNPEAGVWFLERALQCLSQLQEDKQHWWGDMLAWGLALGPWRHLLWYDNVGEMYDARLLRPGGYRVMAYPKPTHDYSPPKGKVPKKLNCAAYITHFKGVRKGKMIKFAERFLLDGDPAVEENLTDEKTSDFGC